MSSPADIPKARIAFATLGVTILEVVLVGLATVLGTMLLFVGGICAVILFGPEGTQPLAQSLTMAVGFGIGFGLLAGGMACVVTVPVTAVWGAISTTGWWLAPRRGAWIAADVAIAVCVALPTTWLAFRGEAPKGDQEALVAMVVAPAAALIGSLPGLVAVARHAFVLPRVEAALRR